ncbi:MAG: hypothetical protein Q4A17_12670 [Thermoguttaceae bacterium]|nr:hypothetical protein [Thermoguttaceae bacterium]
MKVSWNLLSRKKFDHLLIQQRLYAAFQTFQEKKEKIFKKRIIFEKSTPNIAGTTLPASSNIKKVEDDAGSVVPVEVAVLSD